VKRDRSGVRLAVNALSIAPGGGLSALLGYLRAWHELEAPLSIRVYAARPSTLDAIEALQTGATVIPLARSLGPAARFCVQSTVLGPVMKRDGAQLVWSTNSLVGRCKLPQVVHHHNLKHFLERVSLARLKQAGLREVARDLAARTAVKHATCNVFVSRHLKDAAEAFVPSSRPRNHVVHNGIEEAMFARDTGTSPLSRVRGRIISITSPAAHKDNPTLLNMLARLVALDRERSWELLVAGDGNWSAEQSLAKDLRLDSRVRFLGYLDRAQLLAQLRTASCAVFTSRLESFGNGPIEAMAAGCPVVVCNATAMPEVVGEAGLLVQPGDAPAFAEAVLSLERDEVRSVALAKRGQQRAERFRWKDSGLQLLELFCRHVPRRAASD
jgi:glycosyltransferase involved in cell wall biosynthesis